MTGAVLVPLDGSHIAEAAIPFATWLARALQAEIVLLTVTDDLDRGQDAAGGDRLLAHARSYLDGASAQLQAAGPRVRTEVREGKVAESIADRAGADDVALVVLTTLAGGGDTRHLGGMAERLSRTLTKPVLFISPASDAKAPVTGPLIVALDGSGTAESALIPAQDLAGHLRLPLKLVRVAPWANELFAAFTGLAPPAADEEIELGSNTYLANLVEGLPKTLERDYQTLRGHPAEMLVEYARDQNGVLALSSHGESASPLWHLGSTTDKVLRASRAPVLLVPARRQP